MATDPAQISSLLTQLAELANTPTLTPDQATQYQQVQSQLAQLATAAKTDPTLNQAFLSAFAQINPQATPAQQQAALARLQGTAPTPGPTQPGAPGGASITQNPDGSYTIPASAAQALLGSILSPNGTGGNTAISRQVQEQQVAQQHEQQTAVNYVDLPTPAEFLDNFDNDFKMHIAGLQSSGAISAEAAKFAEDNSGTFFADYMRQQVKDLLAGKPLFRVSGLNPDNKLIGTRQGAYSKGSFNNQQQSSYNLNQQVAGGGTSGKVGLDVLFGLQNAPGGPLPGGAAGALDANTAANQAGGSSLSINEQAGLSSLTGQTQSTQEALVQRNKLGVVSNLAPLDFLKGTATPQRINFLYEGSKGTAARAAQTATGEEAPMARRIA